MASYLAANGDFYLAIDTSPAEVEDVVEKIDSAIDNANKLVTKVVRSRRQAGPDVKNAEADERQRLQAELDQLAEKLSKPEYSR